MTIHRAYGYVDRAAVRENEPLRVVMASEGRQADGIDLRMSGADLSRFRANPILGYGHSYWGRINLPIGKVENVEIDGARMAGSLVFDARDEFARTVEQKMRDGYLNAVSIGFEVSEWENDSRRDGIATGWAVHELSVVPVPMDAGAIVTAGRGGLYVEESQLIARALVEYMRTEFPRAAELLAAPLPPPDPGPPADPDPDPAPPAGFVVSETAARDFLAALKS